MMRPEPRLITVDVVPCRIRLLVIWFGEDEARKWIQHTAPAFGKFVQAGTREYILVVDGKYDLEEVAAYLRDGFQSADTE